MASFKLVSTLELNTLLHAFLDVFSREEIWHVRGQSYMEVQRK